MHREHSTIGPRVRFHLRYLLLYVSCILKGPTVATYFEFVAVLYPPVVNLVFVEGRKGCPLSVKCEHVSRKKTDGILSPSFRCKVRDTLQRGRFESTQCTCLFASLKSDLLFCTVEVIL